MQPNQNENLSERASPADSASQKANRPRRGTSRGVEGKWIPTLLMRILEPIASLKLTVVLFFLSILIVFVGTLAQTEIDIWRVIDVYFRVDFGRLFTRSFPWINPGELFVWVAPKVFFPESFFPQLKLNLPSYLGIWLPKGWLIGFVMMLNLFSAHLIRFKVQAKGTRLWVGTGVIVFGTLLTYAVIASGSNPDGLQVDPLLSYATMWRMALVGLFATCAFCIYLAVVAGKDQRDRRWLFSIIAGVLILTALFAMKVDPGDDSTMRILYQVLKATFSSTLLLVGCIAVFKKRGGIVLLHAGIGLMMAYDVLVSVEHVESRMHLLEGQTADFSKDMREPQIAFIDRSNPESDRVIVFKPSTFDRPQKIIDDQRLPFTIEVLEYYTNSTILGPRQPVPEGISPENPATEGSGKQLRAIPVTGATGTDASGGIDIPSLYARVTDRSGKVIGTYLLSTMLDLNAEDSPETVKIGDVNYGLSLRFKRIYNDYSITLNDVQKNNYKGTSTPRDYSSFITLKDPARGVSFDHRIWMNNPMRYAGKTYYQSGFSAVGSEESSTLQVVDNAGWMTPYVACMMVVVGMLYHFCQTLLRYLNRRLRKTLDSRSALPVDTSSDSVGRLTADRAHESKWKRYGLITTAVVLLLAVYQFGKAAFSSTKTPNGWDLTEFGEIPMWYKGRPMPLDTFARNSMLQFSDYARYVDDKDNKVPAIHWLLALMADETKARELRVIRIESEEIQKMLNLPHRKGFTYSMEEIRKSGQVAIEQAMAAHEVSPKDRTLYQRKMVDLGNRLLFYGFLERTLGSAPALPETNFPEETSQVTKVATRAQMYFEYLRSERSKTENTGLGPVPLIIPTHIGQENVKKPNIEELNSKWESLTLARIYDHFYNEFPAPKPEAITKFLSILNAYKANDKETFSKAVKDYRLFLDKYASNDDLPVAKVDFEAWFNRATLFDGAAAWYVIGGVLTLLGWLFLPQLFQRASFWLLVLIFLIHTFALISRVYISGRPPVTNLYSSAVFIGWAVVLGSLIVEMISRLGIGNLAAAIAGFLTLRIAAGLAADGDTFVVLEAVLDTQFWLATHVVCIALGYATTYLAGLFGAIYIFLGLFTKRLSANVGNELNRMIYGILCFATFFSFWGTVLGGLWADDSWGRFWGWDPKENGALIIVLWNALVLHARWGRMVSDRGVAILSVLGNVVVSWSWFGVNELGVGLHSYGFTEGRLMYLGLFVLSQLVIAALALAPTPVWRSKPAKVLIED